MKYIWPSYEAAQTERQTYGTDRNLSKQTGRICISMNRITRLALERRKNKWLVSLFRKSANRNQSNSSVQTV